MEVLIIFGKVVAKNRAFGNSIILKDVPCVPSGGSYD